MRIVKWGNGRLRLTPNIDGEDDAGDDDAGDDDAEMQRPKLRSEQNNKDEKLDNEMRIVKGGMEC